MTAGDSLPARSNPPHRIEELVSIRSDHCSPSASPPRRLERSSIATTVRLSPPLFCLVGQGYLEAELVEAFTINAPSFRGSLVPTADSRSLSVSLPFTHHFANN